MTTWRMAFRSGNRGPSLWSEWQAAFSEVSVLLGAEQLTVKELAETDIQKILTAARGAAQPSDVLCQALLEYARLGLPKRRRSEDREFRYVRRHDKIGP